MARFNSQKAFEQLQNTSNQILEVLKDHSARLDALEGGTTSKAKSATKSNSKPKTSAPKKSGEFNMKAYRQIAEELGCMGKNSVWKDARPIVYGVMEHEGYYTGQNVKPMTRSQAAKAVAKIAASFK